MRYHCACQTLQLYYSTLCCDAVSYILFVLYTYMLIDEVGGHSRAGGKGGVPREVETHCDAMQHLRWHGCGFLLCGHLHACGVAEHVDHAQDGRFFEVPGDVVVSSLELLLLQIAAIPLQRPSSRSVLYSCHVFWESRRCSHRKGTHTLGNTHIFRETYITLTYILANLLIWDDMCTMRTTVNMPTLA
jgi:hypothetical protein